MSRFSYSEVTQIRASLHQDLQRQMPTWRLLAQYIAPSRLKEDLHNKSNDHHWKTRNIIKNQGGRSLRTFVSGMMNGATPKSRPWFNLTVNDKVKKNSSQAKKYFSNTEEIINSYFHTSNLYRVLPMAYKDVGVFSNSAFAMLPHDRYGFYFYPFQIGTYGFACDAEGNTNMFYRDFSMSVKQVVDTFGKLNPYGHIDWTNMPTWVKAMWDQKRYLEIIVLTQVIVPNPQYNPARRNMMDPADRKFQSYTYVQSQAGGIPSQSPVGFRQGVYSGPSTNGSVDGHVFLKVSGFDYFPVITPRWEVNAEENYGVDGPGEIALGDIMTLQQMEKDRLDAVGKLLRPPMVGHASLRRHQASILMGGITYVDDAGAQAGFKPAFTVDPKLSELISDQAEYTNAIRSAFYEDLFLMLSGGETKTHVTAREIDEKAGERMSTLAPVLGQWDQDLCSKLIDNGQIILEGQGRLPKRPRELEGELLRPVYISILAQASKVSMMNSLERGINFAVSMAKQTNRPELLRLIKAEDAIRVYADYVALEPTLMLDEDEFEEITNEVTQNQQAQMALAQQQQSAATMKDLSQAETGKGSMLDTWLDASGA